MRFGPHLLAARRRRHEALGEWPHPSLTELLERRARETPTRVLFVGGDRRITAAEVEGASTRLAAGLRALGIGRGDVVSWQLPNWLEGVHLTFALDRIGAISNPLLPIYREREVSFICRQVGARALIVPGKLRGYDHRTLADAVARDACTIEHVFVARATPAPGQQAFERLLEHAPAAATPTPPGPHDVASVFYTSGTTADPKGVLHTPSTLGALVAVSDVTGTAGPDRVALVSYPLTHIGGIAFGVVLPVRDGSRVVLVEHFDAEDALAVIEREGVTDAGAPPAILLALLRAAGFRRERVRSVRVVGLGAAEVSPDLMRAVAAGFDAFVYRAYGMTECAGATAGRPRDPEEKLVLTDGRPVPGAQVRVVDEAGRPVESGVEGEIELFGPQLCVGYVDAELSTEAFTPDGFLRSGDLGILDGDGFLRITGRKKDIIIRKGENLSAKAIEDELHDHPRIAEVAVIGIPDSECGELVCACVVPHADGGAPPTLEDIGTFMRSRQVMAQKIPERFELLETLPRNAMGKVLKYELRRRFGGGRPA